MPDELTWLPGWQIRELISKREVSPVEVTDHFLGRIDEYDCGSVLPPIRDRNQTTDCGPAHGGFDF